MFFCMLITLVNPSNDLLNHQGRLQTVFISCIHIWGLWIYKWLTILSPVSYSGRVIIIHFGERSSIHTLLCIPVMSQGRRVARECNKLRFSWIQSTDETVRHKCLFVHAVQRRWSFSFIASEKQSRSMKDRRHIHLDRANVSHSCESSTCLIFSLPHSFWC